MTTDITTSQPEPEQSIIGRFISVTIDAGTAVATLRLTRGRRGNAIDARFVADFAKGVRAVADGVADGRVRAVLIDAEGAHFTVGGDLDHFNVHLDRLSAELGSMVGSFHEALTILAELPAPVVAAAQGAVAGGGLGLLWVSDIIIAADNFRLVTAFAKLGVSGDGGSSWFLPRMVGQTRALQLLLESPTVDAAEALALGIVTRVVPHDELARSATDSTRRLALGPTRSLGLQRRLARQAMSRTLAEGFDAELSAMRESGSTDDAREGFSVFVQKRQPTFGGH